jgi:Mg-chelatase subunit ChlD
MTLYIEVVAAATETATKILARRADNRAPWRVAVTCNGGETASVSWQHPDMKLNLPSLPPDSVITRAEADRLVAYIAHECCHVLHTNLGSWQAAVRAGPRVQHWVNALEDVRIEAKEIRNGAFPALHNLLAGLASQKHYEATIMARDIGRVIGAKVKDAPYVACILGRVRNKYAIPTAAPLAGAMSRNVRALVEHALKALPKCKDTFAVYRLARELVAMEAGMAASAAKPSQDTGNAAQGDEAQDGATADEGAPGEAQDGEDGEDGPGAPGEAQDGEDGPGAPGAPGAPGEAQDGEDGPGAPGETQDGEDGPGAPGETQDGEDGATADEGAPGEAQDGEDGAADGHGEAINPASDLADMVKAIAERAGIKDLTRHAAGTKVHRLNTARAWVEPRDPSLVRIDRSYNDAAAAKLNEKLPGNSVLHGQISRLLVSSEIHRRTHHETSGRLDRRAIVRMRTGALDVFSKRDDTPGIDTALLILVDGSGSMCANIDQAYATGIARMDMAQVAAWHIARAAEGANAKVGVVHFHTPREHARSAVGGADIHVAKDWDRSVQDAAWPILSMRGTSYTPLSQAIVGAAEYLRNVNATRHILLVVTDGVCDLGPDTVHAACNIAASMRVEVVGLGMACAEVVDAFPAGYSENIEDLTHLATKGMAVLTRMLEDANPRGAD